MVSLQVISKILATKDYSIVENNLLDESYFVGYESEFDFIKEHYEKYGNVPDKASFLSKFTDIELVEVTESDSYLIDTLREENLYYRSVPVLQKMAEMLKTDANAAAEYLIHEIPNLQPNYDIGGIDIIKNADERFNQHEERNNKPDEWFFTTGFEELDNIIHGFQRGEELVVLFARTNQGKSWILAKMCTHIWQLGFNVGYVSPEMSANSIGYRFDTLNENISNTDLMCGHKVEGYSDYIENLKKKNNRFIVSTPSDFGKKITVTKLKNHINKYKLDLLAIDGITYLTDERYRKGDTKTNSLTNISEDLIGLSVELKIPILVVVQSNRGGVIDKEQSGTPELENIRDSDGIAMNATKVIAIRQTNEGLELGIKKQRSGRVGDKLIYDWDINNGVFKYIPSGCSSKEDIEKVKKEYKRKDKSDVF